MSFFTRRAAGPTLSVSGLEVIHRTDNQPLITCCRHLADRAGRGEGAGRGEPDALLQQHLMAVATEFDRVFAEPGLGEAIRNGDQPWPVGAPRLLNLMLAAAGTALTSDPSLTALIADTVLRARRGSRAAWRLRALAHEHWGDLGSAIDAHQEYLTLIDATADRLGVRARVRDLRELQEARMMLGSVLSRAEQLGVVLPEPSASELLGLLSRPTRQEALDPVLEEFVSDLTQLRIPDLVEIQDVVHAAVRCRRTAALRPGPIPPAEASHLTVLRLGDLRSWLTGKTICLVADSELLAAGDHGWRIDSYDLVARFAPFRIVAAITGHRTDLLVIGHDQASGWEQPTDLRCVLAEDPRDWVKSTRRNLVPGAQRALLDKALRWPAQQPMIVGVSQAREPAEPSSAFQLLRLLDHLDVNPLIDLIGFTLERFADDEREWLASRIRRVDEQRISLR
jgi:hypothetical protein